MPAAAQTSPAITAAADDETPFASPVAERAVLGSILLDPATMDLLTDRRVPDAAFTVPANRTILATFRELAKKPAPIDLLLAVDAMRADKTLEGVGGAMYLESLLDATVTAAYAEYYLDVVMQKHMRARCAATLQKYAAKVKEGDSCAELLRGEIESAFAGLASQQESTTTNEQELESQGTIYANAITGGCAGIRSGFRWWDDAFGGLMPKVLYVVSGPPGCFKTTLVRNILEHVSGCMGLRSDMATLEQSRGQVLASMAARMAHVSIACLNAGRSQDALEKWRGGSKIVSAWPVVVCDRPQTVSSLWSWARRAVSRGSRLLVIDYLQFVKPDDARCSDEQRVSQASEAVREISLRLEVPVICISNESNEGKLRYSGQVEYDAWCWIRMRKDEDAFGNVSGAAVAIRKNRFGPQVPEFKLPYECGAMQDITP